MILRTALFCSIEQCLIVLINWKNELLSEVKKKRKCIVNIIYEERDKNRMMVKRLLIIKLVFYSIVGQFHLNFMSVKH